MGLSRRVRTWAALLLPAVAWFSFQQGLGAVLRVNCGDAWVGIGWGVGALALCGVAAWLAWRAGRGRGETADPWLARMALLGSLVFALAIAFQTLAVALVPPCAR